MSKIAIVYGTSTGATEVVASKLQKAIGSGDIFDVASLSVDQLAPYDFLILGVSTTGYGDMVDDWDAFLPQLKDMDFSGKKVAFVGLGDGESYADTFVNAMGEVYNTIKDSAEVVGAVSTDGYTFEESEADVDGKFVGLVLDEDNEFDQTDARITAWVERLKPYL